MVARPCIVNVRIANNNFTMSGNFISLTESNHWHHSPLIASYDMWGTTPVFPGVGRGSVADEKGCWPEEGGWLRNPSPLGPWENAYITWKWIEGKGSPGGWNKRYRLASTGLHWTPSTVPRGKMIRILVAWQPLSIGLWEAAVEKQCEGVVVIGFGGENMGAAEGCKNMSRSDFNIFSPMITTSWTTKNRNKTWSCFVEMTPSAGGRIQAHKKRWLIIYHKFFWQILSARNSHQNPKK